MQGHVVIVTGAAGNVGAAACRLVAAQGARVVAVDRAPDRLEPVVAALRGDGHAIEAGVDLGSAEAAAALVARVVERYGRLDGLIHTVGAFRMAPLADSDDALWDLMFAANVRTTVNMVRAAARPMSAAGAGAIAAIAAGPALKAPAGFAAYAASKSAVLRLVESAADELKADGVRVNAVLPGIIDTPQNRAAMPGAGTATWVTVDQVASVLAFLVSPAASGITAAAVPITGRG